MSTAGECRLLSVSSILGYGFPEASMEAGLARKPHYIGVDGGSTDPGAFYLGSGECLNSRKAMKRDLRLMLRGGVPRRIPVVIGTCGGAGAEPHLQEVAGLAREIAREEGLKFRMALIHAGRASTRNVPVALIVASYLRRRVARRKRGLGMAGGRPL